jgi:uncharacterized protein (TIGR02996 family)
MLVGAGHLDPVRRVADPVLAHGAPQRLVAAGRPLLVVGPLRCALRTLLRHAPRISRRPGGPHCYDLGLSTTTEEDLLAAIRDHPGDDSILVFADWLLSRGDRRGDLLVLDHRDRTTPGGLRDPDSLVGLLRLAAEFGFPHLPDPDEHLLPWRQVGRLHEYLADHAGRRYWLRCYPNGLIAWKVDDEPLAGNRTCGGLQLTDEETNVILSIASRGVRAGVPFEDLTFPATPEAMRVHPDHRLGPLPMYLAHELAEDFGRDDWSLRARDYDRWYALWHRLVDPRA